MPKCNFNKFAKHLDSCFCMRNVKYRNHSATVYASALFTLAKIISKLKISFYFHTVYTGVFSSSGDRSFHSVKFFSTAILLSSRFVKK